MLVKQIFIEKVGPLVSLLKGLLVANIVHYDGRIRSLKVYFGKGLVLFLTCCIPKLDSDDVLFIRPLKRILRIVDNDVFAPKRPRDGGVSIRSEVVLCEPMQQGCFANIRVTDQHHLLVHYSISFQTRSYRLILNVRCLKLHIRDWLRW